MNKPNASSIQRNTLINLLGSVVPVIVSLVTVPIYLQTVGVARYGALTIVWVLLGYFGFFDMGLGRATSNQTAKLRYQPIQETHDLVWTALLTNLMFGVVGGICLLIIGELVLGRFVKMPEELRPEVVSSLSWLAISVPTITLSSVLSGALEGQERFVVVNAVTVVTNMLMQALPLVLALIFGPNLEWLIICIVLLRYMNIGALGFAYIWRTSISRIPHFQWAKVGELFRYGGWITVTWIVGPLMTSLDQMLITTISGVQALPNYSIPFNFANQISILPYSLTRSLFPRYAIQNLDEAQDLSRQATRMLAVILTPIIVIGIVLIEPFLRLWIGNNFARNAAPIGIVLLIGVWFNCLAYIPYSQLQGQGRPDLPAKFHVYELIPYLLALWAGLQWLGPIGAAVVWSLRAIVDALLLFRAARILRQQARLLRFAVFLVSLISVLALTLFNILIWHVVLGSAAVIATCIWAWYENPIHLKLLLRRLISFGQDVPAQV